MTSPDQLSIEDALAGRVVDGRYRVAALIAHGGMGSVYQAVDLRLEREVAVKVMRPDLARDPEFVRRFQREARSAARLAHPNVVGVYDQGEDGALVFLVMELVNGPTLRRRLTQHGAMSPGQALGVLRGVLSALAAAHTAGIVHRDVKPENVLITPDGAVKVADFGLARAVSATTATGMTGAVLGTAAYLAPEQFERGVADARSDVYATGLLLSEMLTGRKAVDGDEPMQVAYQHVHGTIPLPSERVSGLPSQLDALVEWATRRDPEQRPTDAAQFLAAVEKVGAELTPDQLDHRPDRTEDTAQLATATRVVPLSPRPAAARLSTTSDEPPAGLGPARRSRRVWAAVVALLLIASGASGYQLFGPPAARTVPDVAGQAEAVAVRWLQDRQLDATPDGVFSETVAAGQAISTEPSAGSQARRGSTVRLLVSNGPERYAVPDVVGQDPAAASASITAARLSVAGTLPAFHDKLPAGSVTGTDPAVGSRVRPGTRVTLLVSQGPPVNLENWVGRPLGELKAALSGTAVTVLVTTEEFHPDIDKGSVVRQDPGPGMVTRGSRLSVVLSKGPDLVEVPSVRGLSEDEARGALSAAGFQVQVERIVGGLFKTAHSTVPGAGSKAPRGGVVVLRIV
ncbi:MAG TPA: Stk1 family PASTA domain-containing Ser/Thr kinase [Dermatophilaceae bacterium]|nr:Stk1 family PASTA domain-containing Ser/Thr kinase [Dermatophilaceae bacterium]